MKNFSGLLGGLVKSLSLRESRGKHSSEGGGRKVSDSMVRDARKKDMILRSSGKLRADGSDCFVSVFSKRGEKGINQDCSIVWKEFGCQEDMIFCGIFDGHGPWGHYVSKSVRDSLPSSLLCNWQEALATCSVTPDDIKSDKKSRCFDVWKYSYVTSCACVDEELQRNRRLDSFHSGTTALTVVKQGEVITLGNVGDSRAVLATLDDNSELTLIQLTQEFKPDLPAEAERIRQCEGRVFCLEDEPGVHRIWMPNEDTPGLSMSRAFGDFCVKDHGLVSVPEVVQRDITSRDQFLILASDGVWDVMSNEEAVRVVYTCREKEKAAKKLVECAVRAWQRKRKNIAFDDCSAICIFFDSGLSSTKIIPT